MSYSLTTNKSWSETRGDLGAMFAKWGVRDWAVSCPSQAYDSYRLSPAARAVTIRYTHPRQGDRELTYGKQARPVDNIRVLWLVLQLLEEEEPMSELTVRSVDDLAGPTLARLRELAGQVEKAEELARSLRAEAARFVQVLDLLGVDFPEQLRVRVVARAQASPLSKTKAPVPFEERWKCVCGWRSSGRYPGNHTQWCEVAKAAKKAAAP